MEWVIPVMEGPFSVFGFVKSSLADAMKNIQVSRQVLRSLTDNLLFKNIFECSQNSLPVTINEKCFVIRAQFLRII